MGEEESIKDIGGKARSKEPTRKTKTYVNNVATPRGRSIERPLLINGYAYSVVSFPKQQE
jgi:hypothetical protein